MASFHISKQLKLATDRGRADKPGAWKVICGVLLLCAATSIVAPAQTFTTLAYLSETADNSKAALAQGIDGNLYGTTYDNNAIFRGSVFRITTAGTLATLHTFDFTDGSNPTTELLLATDGDFYGTTSFYGASGVWEAGTVFKITPGGKLTTLHSFCSQANCTDGAGWPGALVQGADGNFYGTTSSGGAYGYGTVFKISPYGRLVSLKSFCHQATCPDGVSPRAGLVAASDGSFYGITELGGTGLPSCWQSPSYYGCGTIFKITPKGLLTTLYSFCVQSGCPDGSSPSGRLIEATDENFYGTTGSGGAFGNGTVFKIAPGGKWTALYSFCSQTACTDGSNPQGGLTQATDGNLYGTTVGGGAYGYGTIFEITTSGTLTTLHSFEYGDALPEARPMQATDGNFYGTTWGLDFQSYGTVYSLSMGFGPFVSFIRDFNIVGAKAQILGQGFTGTSAVSFNGTPATFTVIHDTYLSATVPAGATTGFVTVTTPSGTLTSNKIFRVTPQILSISPTSGPAGTSVVITGESLTGADDVRLGYGEQMSFTVDSDTQITAIVPAAATSGAISVHTPGGQAKSATAFNVTP